MSILLSDDEIRVAKAEAVRLSWTHKTHPSYEKDKFLLEAQLKKVGKRLREFDGCVAGLDLKHPEYYAQQGFIVCPVKYWQALLKELE